MTHLLPNRPRPADAPAPREDAPPLAELTDLCVKCGLCLPHCPTYALTRQEGDSPRGRIALIQGLLAGKLEPDGRLTEHVAGCLTCRTCESVCPAKVPYGEIIDRGRASLRQGSARPEPGVGPLRALARRPWLIRQAPGVLAVARAVGLAAVARRLAPRHWLSRALALRPVRGSAPAPGTVHEPRDAARGEVSLFLGCVARGLDAPTLTASVAAVTALGFRVRIPAGQGCCGALDLHDGRHHDALATARENGAAFAAGAGPILCAATGCATTLVEYARYDDDPARSVAARVQDVGSFVLAHLGDRALTGPERRLRVAVHTSCSARLLPGGGGDVITLLGRIPNVEPVELVRTRCCGAAGHHFLTRATQADALLEPLLEELSSLAPGRIVTANPGCALHLAAGLRRRGPLRVSHPLDLVVSALRGDW